MEPQTLSDGLLTLRRVGPADAATIADAVRGSLSELMRWMPWAHKGYSSEDTRRWIERAETDGSKQFVMLLDGEVVGVIEIMAKPDDVGELGYWVRTDVAGRGLCTRAARLAAAHAYALGKRRVEIRADVANLASQRVAEKSGGARQPSIDRHMHDDGSTHELVVFVVPPPPS